MIYRYQLGAEFREHIINIIETMKEHYVITMPPDFKQMSNSDDAYRSPGSITYADYYNKELKNNPPYRQVLIDKVDPISKEIAEKNYCNSWTYKSMWYHEYHKGDSFEWHNHQNSHMTAIYFIEMPKNQTTEVMGIGHLPAEQGEIVFFPSIYVHRSSIITTDERKKIIAFVMNFHYTE